MKMRKRVEILLESAQVAYDRNKNLPNGEFVNGKSGKKLFLAQWVARISTLQHLLNDESWEK